jgi:hypothetical protein
MPSVTVLMRRRDRLVMQVKDNLDFLIGSVSTKGLKCEAFNLTTKVDGKIVTRHIPIGMVPAVRRMTERHGKLKGVLKELGETNWLLAKEGVELKDYGTL